MNKTKQTVWLVAALLLAPFVLSGRSTKLRIMNLVNSLQTHPTLTYRTRSKEQITQIVIHHSGGSDTHTVQDFARWHVENNGWPGIGYHFVIAADGKVAKTNELTTISYHATNCNANSIGICLTGNFNEKLPEAIQIAHLKNLIRTIENELGRQLVIVGHRDCKNTSCPGSNFNVAAFVADLRVNA